MTIRRPLTAPLTAPYVRLSTIKKNAIIKLSNWEYISCTKKTPQNCDVFSTIYISVRFLDSKTHFFHTLQLPLQQLFHFQALHKQ